MAQTIKLKRSSVAGNVPESSNLSLGEIAVNTTDGAVYIKKGNNDIVTIHDNDILHINSDTGNSGADQRVGIGTTSPSQKLHVNGTILVNNEIQFVNDQMRIYRSTNDMKIRTGSTDRVTITSTGNVGIGTSTPSKKLEVVDRKFRGTNFIYTLKTTSNKLIPVFVHSHHIHQHEVDEKFGIKRPINIDHIVCF